MASYTSTYGNEPKRLLPVHGAIIFRNVKANAFYSDIPDFDSKSDFRNKLIEGDIVYEYEYRKNRNKPDSK